MSGAIEKLLDRLPTSEAICEYVRAAIRDAEVKT